MHLANGFACRAGDDGVDDFRDPPPAADLHGAAEAADVDVVEEEGGRSPKSSNKSSREDLMGHSDGALRILTDLLTAWLGGVIAGVADFLRFGYVPLVFPGVCFLGISERTSDALQRCFTDCGRSSSSARRSSTDR